MRRKDDWMVVLAFFTLIFVVGCIFFLKPPIDENPNFGRPQLAEKSAKHDQFCDKRVDRNSSAKEILAAMDHDIDAVEHESEVCGSFGGYFIPNTQLALKAGASRKEVDVRIEKVIALAKNGKFFDSYQERLVKDFGVGLLEGYEKIR